MPTRSSSSPARRFKNESGNNLFPLLFAYVLPIYLPLGRSFGDICKCPLNSYPSAKDRSCFDHPLLVFLSKPSNGFKKLWMDESRTDIGPAVGLCLNFDEFSSFGFIQFAACGRLK